MTKLLIFADIVAFEAENARLDSQLGYPNGRGTVTYASPLVGPDGRCLMQILPEAEPYFSPERLAECLSEVPPGWFPEV
jgi:hypothetical protein